MDCMNILFCDQNISSIHLVSVPFSLSKTQHLQSVQVEHGSLFGHSGEIGSIFVNSKSETSVADGENIHLCIN